jgi:uncharacterized protein YggE
LTALEKQWTINFTTNHERRKAMRTLKVQGKASVALPPDTAVFSFGILAEHKEYNACHENLNRRVALLRQELADCGIERAEVKTTNYRNWGIWLTQVATRCSVWGHGRLPKIAQ